MEELTYRVGDIRKMIKESSIQLKPVLGDKVESENKRNNEKSYKESGKRTTDYNKAAKQQQKEFQKKVDDNRTTLDYNLSSEASENYKKRIKSQSKGYTSELEEKNGNERANAKFDDDLNIYNQFKDSANTHNKNKKEIEKSGLQSRELSDKVFDKNTMYENVVPKTKLLKFKWTKFLNEAQMLSLIPEEYKKDKQKIIMRDKNENEYIVECERIKKTNNIAVNVISYSNKKLVKEEVNRIHELMGYSTSDVSGKQSVEDKINENKNFTDMMNIVRNIRKE